MWNFLWRLWVLIAVGALSYIAMDTDVRLNALEQRDPNSFVYDTVSYRMYGLEGIRWVNGYGARYPVYTPVYVTDEDLNELGESYMMGALIEAEIAENEVETNESVSTVSTE